MYVKVINFEQKLNYDLIEQCNEFSYSFDNIPNIQNGIDIKVIFDMQKNYVSESMMLSVTPCLLKTLSIYEENFLKEKLINNNIIENNSVKKYLDIKQKFFDLKNNNIDKIDKLTQEEKNKIILELNEYSKLMEEILLEFEEKELWDNIDEATNVAAYIIEFIDLVNKKQ